MDSDKKERNISGIVIVVGLMLTGAAGVRMAMINRNRQKRGTKKQRIPWKKEKAEDQEEDRNGEYAEEEECEEGAVYAQGAEHTGDTYEADEEYTGDAGQFIDEGGAGNAEYIEDVYEAVAEYGGDAEQSVDAGGAGNIEYTSDAYEAVAENLVDAEQPRNAGDAGNTEYAVDADGAGNTEYAVDADGAGNIEYTGDTYEAGTEYAGDAEQPVDEGSAENAEYIGDAYEAVAECTGDAGGAENIEYTGDAYEAVAEYDRDAEYDRFLEYSEDLEYDNNLEYDESAEGGQTPDDCDDLEFIEDSPVIKKRKRSRKGRSKRREMQIVRAAEADARTDNDEEELPVIKIYNVSMVFKVATSSTSGLKDYIIQKLKKQITTRDLLALDKVSFDVFKGEVVGIIGTNGSGKSTLLKIVSGAMKPTSGQVLVDKSKIQLLTLGTGFDMELSARENVYLNGAIIGYSREFINAHYDEIVAFAELEGFMDTKVKNFSSGMVSRLGFAIATVGDAAEILILDEVLSVGDEFFRKKSLKRIKEMIHGGSTVIMVSHSMGTILENCTKVVWIEKGVLQMVGDARTVCKAYQEMGKR